jgi:hypothetical protein
MSTQERVSVTSWWLEYVRRVISQWVRKTTAFAALISNIVCRPTRTSKEVILDDDPKGLLRALKYYSKMFALTFAIYVFANRYQLYEGESEWRTLLQFILQFLVAIPLIYLFCLVTRERIPFLRLIQAVAFIPLFYLTLIVPSENRELDIFATEYERCLSNGSIFYWLLRGDLKYFLYNDVWKPQDWINLFSSNVHYIVVAPFVPIFAFMLRPTRKIGFILICLITPIAFVTVMEGADFIKSRLSLKMAVENKQCTFGFLDQVINKYAPNLIAKQIAYKINNDSLKAHQFFAPLIVERTNLVLATKIKPDVDPTSILRANVPFTIRKSYCSDYHYWLAARMINYNLLFVVYDKDDTILHRELITPKDCPKWPMPPLPPR